MKAPMLPELAMDWIVEVTSERYYGPTTLGAIREFMRLGEINEQNFVINSCDASRQQIHAIAPLLAAQAAEEQAEVDESNRAGGMSAPAAAGMSIAIQDRIRELEEALREERRALAEAEQRYRALEEKHRPLRDERAVT